MSWLGVDGARWTWMEPGKVDAQFSNTQVFCSVEITIIY